MHYCLDHCHCIPQVQHIQDSFAIDSLVTDGDSNQLFASTAGVSKHLLLQAEHLSHWGINMMAMQKTERTMAEAEIEANKGFEWNHITEAGKQLTAMSGPG